MTVKSFKNKTFISFECKKTCTVRIEWNTYYRCCEIRTYVSNHWCVSMFYVKEITIKNLSPNMSTFLQYIFIHCSKIITRFFYLVAKIKLILDKLTHVFLLYIYLDTLNFKKKKFNGDGCLYKIDVNFNLEYEMKTKYP